MLAVFIVMAPVVGLAILAWVLMPAGFLGAAWPAALLSLVPALAVLPMLVLARLHERSMDRAAFARRPESAAQWARRKLSMLGLDSVDVVTYEDASSAYHGPSDSIILSERTYAEHTVRALGVAAHELGHAAAAHFRPLLSRLTLACRAWGDRLFYTGVSALVATALIAAPGFQVVALGLLVASAVMSLVVVLDEAAASLRAARILAGEIGRPALRSVITGYVLALMTYVFCMIPTAAALIYWPELTARLGTGVVELSGPLAGWSAALAHLGCLVVVVASVASLLDLVGVDLSGRGGLKIFSVFGAVVIGPALTFALAGQAAVIGQPWALAIAAASAWHMIALPAALAVWLGAKYATRGIELLAPVTRFLDGPQMSSLAGARRERVSQSALARHERESLLERLWAARLAWIYLPLILVYWGLLG